MAILAQIQEILLSLVNPWQFMFLAASWFPGTVVRLVRDGNFGVLLSPSRLKEAWFSNFWDWFAPRLRLNAGVRVIPLLEGRTTGGRVVEEPAGPGIGGTIIEIGAGSGNWVDVFSDKPLGQQAAVGSSGAEMRETTTDTTTHRGGTEKTQKKKSSARKPITRVYGVEPNRDQHAALRRNIKAAGLEGVYEIVPVGIEHLDDPTRWDGRVEKGSVDCIVSVLCLCSIPEPRENLRELYGYLKKGGRWYVYEHVRRDEGWGMRAYQAFVNLFWPHFLGGCQLCRPTEQWLREAGPWEKIDVGHPQDEEWHHTLPHILGVFTK
ncbi:S-adenosyl-L-methionine-dependent methyltransferase [Apiospora rasikravindrae]|uniref:S-adenosyl-L-methionine-dependent methyltransferase n=1 Tax=Apiospora rasikravindrae TaxID=990691 RepID=A0ABR1T891_9PEZI